MYWAGFLMADGCISRRPWKSDQVRCELKESDKDHIYKLTAFFGLPADIVKFSRENASVRVSDQEMSDRLAQYGVTPRKTFTAKALGDATKNVHFWRGVIDGDGTVSIHLDYTPRLMLTSASIDLPTQFCSWLETIDVYTSPFMDTVWRVQVYGAKAYRAIAELYDGEIDEISLDRKRVCARKIAVEFERRYANRIAQLSLI